MRRLSFDFGMASARPACEAAVLDHPGEVEQIVEVTTADICDEHGTISCGSWLRPLFPQIGL